MSKVAEYLQQHLVGEVTIGADAREHFSTDASVFKIVPQIVAYPRNENDVRKCAKFSWQLAERNKILPITARGLGTDLTGAAIGPGVSLVFPAHLNKVVELNTKKRLVAVQPGVNFGKLQQTLHTHGLYLPFYPSSVEYSTIGGAVANNAGGELSGKYGSALDFVKSLKVVLANGEIIETGKLTKKELNKKKGIASLEGEIYRSVDDLLEQNESSVNGVILNVLRNGSGYNLHLVKSKGFFDLTPLFVGSQGTLGVITEILLEVLPYSPEKNAIMCLFPDYSNLAECFTHISKLEPSAFVFIDSGLNQLVQKSNPNLIDIIDDEKKDRHLVVVEFDDLNSRIRTKKTKKLEKILKKYEIEYVNGKEDDVKEEIEKVKQASSTAIWQSHATKKALPVIEDVILPVEVVLEFLVKAKKLITDLNVDVVFCGNIGEGNLQAIPYFDLTQIGDKQKVFKLLDAYYSLAISMGGALSSQNNDGRLRGPLLKELYGDEVYDLLKSLKDIFDPYGILNPGVKFNTNRQAQLAIIRTEYNLSHFYNNFPRY